MEGQDIHSAKLLYDYALSFLGLPYRWGGDDPVNGVDCSGLCIELLQSVGVFPHGQDTTAAGLKSLFDSYKKSEGSFGALVFFGSSGVTHVGFCLNDKLMVEAGGGGSRTKTREDAAVQNAYVRIRPIRTRSDLVGFVMPPYPWRR